MDAIKNYFIPGWYIRYDNGLWFTGMNYPFGDHAIYTDNQLPISWVCQQLQRAGFNIAEHTPALLNYLLLLSFFPCAVFLFLILDEFRVARWYAIPCAVLITLLSPQVQRMNSHLSLAYPFVIPMAWYFLMRMLRSGKPVKWMILNTGAILFSGLIHLYYAAILGLFIFSFAIVYLLVSKTQKNFSIRIFISMLVTALLPILLLRLFISITDPVQDRIRIPYGFLAFHADFQTVFYPPYWSWNKLFGTHQRVWEGYAFVGIVGQVAFLAFSLRTIWYSWKRKFRKIFFLPLPEFMIISFWAAVPVLLFSIALPWIWGLQSWLNYIPLIQQFRSVGRFAWVFYYVFSVYSAYYFFIVCRMILFRNMSSLAYFIVALLITGWSVDGFYNLKRIGDGYNDAKIGGDVFRNREYAAALAAKGYTPENFQAVLSFPLFVEGTEKLALPVTEASLTEGAKSAFTFGLPMIDGFLGRTSLSQGMKLMQMASGPGTEKILLKEMKSDLPILLVVNHFDDLSFYEKEIIARATPLYSNTKADFYKLTLENLKSEYDWMRSRLYREPVLLKKDFFYITSPTEAIIMKKNPGAAKDTFLSKGFYSDSGRFVWYEGTIPAASDSQIFEISFWEKAFTDSYQSPKMHYRQFDANGRIVDEQLSNPCIPTENYNGWFLANYTFTLRHASNTISLVMEGKNIEVDRLLIKPQGMSVYSEVTADTSFVFDNHFIKSRAKSY